MVLKGLPDALVALSSSMLKKAVDENQTLAFSPWSLIHTLLIFMKTAKGTSVNELIKGLKLPESMLEDKNIIEAIKSVSDDKSVETAAGVFVRKLKPTKEYNETIEKVFGTGIEPLLSADQINSWCSKATHEKITNVISSLDPTDVMVLISAIYFKADWESPFNLKMTTNLPFHKLDGTQYDTSMMRKSSSLRYLSTKEFLACRLPYNDSGVNAVIILPNKKGAEGLKEAIEKFDAGAVADIMYGGSIDVDLTLPKFKISSSRSLVGELKDLGANEMFKSCNTEDNLGEDTYVSDVFQKCIVEVDEKGTVAAAVTGMMMRTMCMPMEREKITMCCDRPFLFYLIDAMSQIVLFSTVILNP